MLSLTLTEASDAGRRGAPRSAGGNGVLPPAIRDDVLLLASELVTNAVRHAGVRPEDQCRFRPLGRFGARAVTGHAAFEEVTRR